jgi:hypothetical protein
MTIILYDDRDLKVDVFDYILENYKNIACMISGGADSSFALYWLAKCIDELELHNTHTILPITAMEDLSVLAYNNIKEVKEIISIVQNYFPKVQILDHYTFDAPTTESKGDAFFTHKKILLNSGFIDHIFSSICAAPLFEDVDFGFAITVVRNIEKQRRKGKSSFGVDYKYVAPFGFVDKKFIAYQYKKYDLLNTIYPLTRSCTSPYPDGKACKNCPWCFEKYWAFGMYDNCITRPKPKWENAKRWTYGP